MTVTSSSVHQRVAWKMTLRGRHEILWAILMCQRKVDMTGRGHGRGHPAVVVIGTDHHVTTARAGAVRTEIGMCRQRGRAERRRSRSRRETTIGTDRAAPETAAATRRQIDSIVAEGATTTRHRRRRRRVTTARRSECRHPALVARRSWTRYSRSSWRRRKRLRRSRRRRRATQQPQVAFSHHSSSRWRHLRRRSRRTPHSSRPLYNPCNTRPRTDRA